MPSKAAFCLIRTKSLLDNRIFILASFRNVFLAAFLAILISFKFLTDFHSRLSNEPDIIFSSASSFKFLIFFIVSPHYLPRYFLLAFRFGIIVLRKILFLSLTNGSNK